MNRVTDYSGLYLIIGPPGTGKTTFLTKQVREIAAKAHAMERTAPVLLCSLTRTAAQELAGRKMPIPSSHIGTLHAHAYRMMERPELAELHLAEWNEANRAYAITGEGAAPDLEGESGGDEPSGGGSSYGDKAYQLYTVSRAQKLERAKWPQALRLFAQKWEEWKRDAGLLDFTDLIEVATASLDCPEGIEVVIADEAQDLSALELDLLRKWGTQAGALMIAGDPYQALYTWRGACPEIFQDAQVPLRLLRQTQFRNPVRLRMWA
jgi:superfamily I DNA/RNA helicase